MTTAPKLPFDCQVLNKEPTTVVNKFTGQKAILTPEAVAVYDTIKGAEALNDHKIMQKGLKWFVNNYPKEYMILLD